MIPHNLVRSAFGLVALTGCLLVFGSTVRVHGAGLACPDWPLCFGQVVPTINFRVGLEFGHRVVAGLVSLGFLGILGWSWRVGAFASRTFRTIAILACLALAAQVVLGGLTVLELLAEWTVASHLVTGNTFCALLLLLALTLRELRSPRDRAAVSTFGRGFAVALSALVPLQLALGGLVAGSNAGLACGTWPSCNGAGWFPTFAGLVGLQVTHRVMAYTLLAGAWAHLLVAARSPTMRRPAALFALAITVQALIGIANVLLHLPVEVTLLHSAGAATAHLAAYWQAHEALRAPVRDAAVLHLASEAS